MNEKLVLSKTMAETDKLAIEKYGIPGIVLMENASLAVFDVLEKNYKLEGKTFLILAGKGGNGGDAFAVARHLITRLKNITISIFAIETSNLREDTKINFDILVNMGVKILNLSETKNISTFNNILKKSDIVIDGLLGTGIKGKPRGIYETIIKTINSFSALHKKLEVVAIDIPSGLNSDTGSVTEKVAIKANLTITFGLKKAGQLLYMGPDYTGKLVLKNIGFPQELLERAVPHLLALNEKKVRVMLPERKAVSHKGTYGKIFIVAGSRGYIGAALLCAKSALKSGAGLVYLGVPDYLAEHVDTRLYESITVPLPVTNTGYIKNTAFQKIKKYAPDILVLGPGLGQNISTQKLIETLLIQKKFKAVVIDADGLNLLAKNIKILKEACSPVILTPHIGEMARLCELSTREVLENQVEIVKEFSKKWNVFLILKSARSLCAYKNTVFINSTGNSSLARGGSGDVFTGMLASFLGQKSLNFEIEILETMACAAYIFGKTAEILSHNKSEYNILPSEIPDNLHLAINLINKESGI